MVRVLHVPLPSPPFDVRVNGKSRPGCLVLEPAQVSDLDDLCGLLRSLRARGPALIDAYLVHGTPIGDRVKAAFQEALAALPEHAALVDLVVRLPAALLLFPEIGAAIAAFADNRQGDLFIELGRELNRRRKRAPGPDARHFRDQRDLDRELERLRTGAVPSMASILRALDTRMADPGRPDWFRKTLIQSKVNQWRSGANAPQARWGLMNCSEHAGRRGLFEAELPDRAGVVAAARGADHLAIFYAPAPTHKTERNNPAPRARKRASRRSPE